MLKQSYVFLQMNSWYIIYPRAWSPAAAWVLNESVV